MFEPIHPASARTLRDLVKLHGVTRIMATLRAMTRQRPRRRQRPALPPRVADVISAQDAASVAAWRDPQA